MSVKLDEVVVELKADDSGFTSAFTSAQRRVSKFETESVRSMSNFDDAVKRARNTILTMGTAYAAFRVGKGIIDAGVQIEGMRNRMLAATGDARVAGEALAFVRAEANRLGLDIRTATDGFSGFSASALRAGLTFQQTKEIFIGVSEAATSMRLPAEQTALVFKALEQIAGKGVVSMEELRGQLGDALPGAFEIAAKSMGKTTAEFSKMVADGEVLSTDFLPKFGAAVRKELGGSVEEAAQGAQAAFNRMGNAFFDLQTKMAESGFLDAVTSSVNQMTEALNDPNTVEGLRGMADLLGDIIVGATQAAAAIGGFYAEFRKGSDAFIAVAEQAKNSGEWFVAPGEMADRAKQELFRRKILAEYIAKQQAPASADTGTSDGFTLGTLSKPANSKVDKAREQAQQKASRLREQLSGQVDSFSYSLASPEEQAAMDVEKQQELLREALEAKAITEQEFRELGLQAEMQYQDELTQLRQRATDLEVGMREKALNNIQGLLQVFAGKNKAIAIAMLAFDKARAIAQAVMETHVAAAAALKYDPTGATSARVTMMGYANVAAIAATGIAQLATMGSSGGSASSSGSSGSSTSSSDTGVAAGQSTTSAKEVKITLYGSSYTKNDIRTLIEGLNDAFSDGSRLLITGSAS